MQKLLLKWNDDVIKSSYVSLRCIVVCSVIENDIH